MKIKTAKQSHNLIPLNDPFFSNLDMLTDIRREMEQLILPSDSETNDLEYDCTHLSFTIKESWQRVMSKIAKRLSMSNPESIPLAALVQSFNLSELDTTILMILFFVAVNSNFHLRFDPDASVNQDPEDSRWISFKTLIEKTELDRVFDRETLFGTLSPAAPLVASHLIGVSYNFDKDDPQHDPDIAIGIETLLIMRGALPKEEELYKVEHPTTRLDQVVLPMETKRKLLTLIANYNEVQRQRTHLNLDDTIEYGQAAVILFHGRSGTGKTMLARAISNYTGKPLITPRLGNSLFRRFHRQKSHSDLGRIFFETEWRNGILFLDECEEFLSEDSDELPVFLRELEQCRCIVILSTNVPDRIYASFDRRISLKIEFEPPDSWQRLEIWKTLIPSKMKLDQDVDLQALAQLFPMTGGYIKNALLYAINLAIHRNPGSPCLSWADLEEACCSQEAHLGIGSTWRQLLKTPKCLDDIHLAPEDIIKSRSIAERFVRINKRVNLFVKNRTIPLPGPKVLLQALTNDRADQIAIAIAAEVSQVVCIINASDVLIRGYVGKDEVSAAIRLAEVISANAASGKLIVLREAELLLGDLEENGSTLSNQQIREIILTHPAAIICVAGNDFRLPRNLSSYFSEIFRESADNPSYRLKIWKDILPEFSLEWSDTGDETTLSKYALEPDEIRRVILLALWKVMAEGDVSSIPIETLCRFAEQIESSRKQRGFDIFACK